MDSQLSYINWDNGKIEMGIAYDREMVTIQLNYIMKVGPRS